MGVSSAGSYLRPASSINTRAPSIVSVYALCPPAAPEPTTITSYVFPLTVVGSMKGIFRSRRSSYGADPDCIGQRCVGVRMRRYELVRQVTRVAEVCDG